MATPGSLEYDAQSNAGIVIIPCIVFLAVSPIVVGIRLWSRHRSVARIGADDVTICVSLVFAMASSAVLVVACHYGYGKHISSLSTSDRENALMYFYISQFTYKISINTTKASILLLYLRIFVQKRFRMACWILLGFVTLFGIATTLASVFQCTPIARTWNKSIKGVCVNTTIFWYANAGFSIVGDLVLLALPMPILYNLKLPLNQRLAVMLVFSLGTFVVVTTILRMTTLNTTSTSPDPTYECQATMWTVIEGNIALTCACLPLFRMFLVSLFPRLFPASTNSRTGLHSEGAYGNLSKPGNSNNSRIPSVTNALKSTAQSSSVATGKRDSGEEYILQDMHGRQSPGDPANAIRKVTQFTIHYDDDGSSQNSTSKSATKM